ncbi:MAG: hypothetical protein AAB602_00060 [Patescibacteria group bacterium]
MTETTCNAAEKTAECGKRLADLRPPEGEYFYTDGDTTHYHKYRGKIAHFTCFVCEYRTSDSYVFSHIHAIAQCMAAGNRIASMFKPGSCCGPFPRDEGGVCLIVSFCDKHTRNAGILCDFVKDGVITLERVSHAEISGISRQEFHELVETKANAIWKEKERARRVQDWYDSWGLCLQELGRIPSLAERNDRARRLYELRKDTQAVQDWLDAEKIIAATHAVATA